MSLYEASCHSQAGEEWQNIHVALTATFMLGFVARGLCRAYRRLQEYYIYMRSVSTLGDRSKS